MVLVSLQSHKKRLRLVYLNLARKEEKPSVQCLHPALFSFQLSREGLASQHSQGLTPTLCYYPKTSVTLCSTLAVVHPWSFTHVLYKHIFKFIQCSADKFHHPKELLCALYLTSRPRCSKTQAKRATFPMQIITHTIAQLDEPMSLRT